MWVSLMFGCVLQNVWGALRLSQAFLPDLRASRGRLIMISSIAGFFAIPRTGTYCEYLHGIGTQPVWRGLESALSRVYISSRL